MNVVGNEGDDALLELVPVGGREMGGLVELDRALGISQESEASKPDEQPRSRASTAVVAEITAQSVPRAYRPLVALAVPSLTSYRASCSTKLRPQTMTC